MQEARALYVASMSGRIPAFLKRVTLVPSRLGGELMEAGHGMWALISFASPATRSSVSSNLLYTSQGEPYVRRD